MKKIILFSIVALLFVSINGQSQSKFKGFFKPAQLALQDPKLKSFSVEPGTSKWLFRPAVFVTADAIKFEGGAAVTQPLSSIGTGISYSNYISLNGEPYSQLSVSALIMTNINLNGTSLTSMGGGLIVGAWNGLINAGYGNIGGKSYLLLGTQLKF